MAIEPTQKRYQEIDALYSIGILAVLIGHSHSSENEYGRLLHHVILYIYVFHMPLFFAIAGFLFFNSNTFKNEFFFKWISNKAARLMTPYFVWSLLGIIPKYLFENGSLRGLHFETLVRSLVIPRENVWGHFWFLPVLLMVYASLGSLRTILGKNKNDVAFLTITTITTAVLYFFPIKSVVLGLSDFSNLSVYFVLGMLVCDGLNHGIFSFPTGLKKKVFDLAYCCAIAAATATLARYAASNKFLALTLAVLSVGVCVVVAGYIKRLNIVKWLSQHNLTIYIFGWLFQAVVMTLCDYFVISWIWTFILMLTSGILGPYSIIKVYEGTSWLNNKTIGLFIGAR